MELTQNNNRLNAPGLEIIPLYRYNPQLAALVGFAVFFNGWAVLSYRKSGH